MLAKIGRRDFLLIRLSLKLLKIKVFVQEFLL